MPFSFETELSGIHDVTYHDHVWYHKHLEPMTLKKDERLILHFEGVDYFCEVYVNGCFVKSHYGSNGSFKMDITKYLKKKMTLLFIATIHPKIAQSLEESKIGNL